MSRSKSASRKAARRRRAAGGARGGRDARRGCLFGADGPDYGERCASATADAPNSIFWQKNYNSGGVVADETAKDARTAHVKIYHDAEHASAIDLPLR